MDAILTGAVFIICWWLCFFCMLPIGVKNLDEAGDPGGFGQERAAPVAPNLKQKALWAAGLAAVLTALIWVLVAIDLFGLRR
jgi:predicted secreted protein